MFRLAVGVVPPRSSSFLFLFLLVVVGGVLLVVVEPAHSFTLSLFQPAATPASTPFSSIRRTTTTFLHRQFVIADSIKPSRSSLTALSFSSSPSILPHRSIHRNNAGSLSIRGGSGVHSNRLEALSSAMSFYSSSLITTTVSTLVGATKAGPWGVASLWAVAASVVVPLTIYRQGYAFSVGYGCSVLAMAVYLGRLFGSGGSGSTLPLLLMGSAVVYGLRLGSYLLLRELASPTKASQIKSFDKSSRLQRIPFAASVALFYAFLMTPLLYVLRSSASGGTVSLLSGGGWKTGVVLTVGVIMAWAGAGLEAVADYHKFYIKQKHGEPPPPKEKDEKDDEKEESKSTAFVGPTGGVYQLTRHPNYTGEVLFWLGHLIAGIPFYHKSAVAWICSLVGFYGIYSIMTMATKRLEERQKESYGGQSNYEEWRSTVKAPIFPFVNVE